MTTSPIDTEFHWRTYRDATLAGLSVLIPIPIIDWFFEEFYRRRVPLTIAKQVGKPLEPIVVGTLNRGESKGCLNSCLLLPITGLIELIKRISRKIVYFLTIKEATDKVSFYWHQAFLINHMILLGHLDTLETTVVAKKAMQQTLDEITTSPLFQLAEQITQSTRYIFRSLRRARQGTEDAVIEEKRSRMRQAWGEFEEYLEGLAKDYNRTYEQLTQAQKNMENAQNGAMGNNSQIQENSDDTFRPDNHN